jgi:hypothetical protein
LQGPERGIPIGVSQVGRPLVFNQEALAC